VKAKDRIIRSTGVFHGGKTCPINGEKISFCKLILTLLLICSAPALTFADTTGGASKLPSEFGVFPYLPPRQLESVFAPVAIDLSSALGEELIFTTAISYDQFSNKLDNKQFDIAFIQPFDYIRRAKDAGYIPLATPNEPLKAVIATIDRSPLKTLEDLRGGTITLPPKTAAVSILTTAHFIENGFMPGVDIHFKYTRSHMSCMHQVLIGNAIACGTALPPLRFFENKMKAKTRVIEETRSIPHTLFVIHSRVSKKDREAILKRILTWSKLVMGREFLRKGKFKPFKAAKDSDYDIVREYLEIANKSALNQK